MRDDLVPEEVEIDPVSRGTTLPTAEQIPVKIAGFCQVPNRESKVKTGPRCHVDGLFERANERSKPDR
jgi:hypothetical protein